MSLSYNAWGIVWCVITIAWAISFFIPRKRGWRIDREIEQWASASDFGLPYKEGAAMSKETRLQIAARLDWHLLKTRMRELDLSWWLKLSNRRRQFIRRCIEVNELILSGKSFELILNDARKQVKDSEPTQPPLR